MSLAISLSGGGAKGAFQVGVLKNLIKNQGLKPDRIDGTSTGALQAAGLNHLGIDGLEAEWLKIKRRSDIMKLNWWPHLFTLGLTLNGIYSMAPLAARLLNIQAQPKCDEISAEIRVTKVHLETGEIKYARYDEPDFLESIVASCSIPVLNPPINGWVDGGVRDQIPIRHLVSAGYRKIICIITNPINREPESWKIPTFMMLPKLLIRLADDILPFESWHSEVEYIYDLTKMGFDIQVYAPEKLLLQTQEFNPEKIRAAIEQGYQSSPVNLMEILK